MFSLFSNFAPWTSIHLNFSSLVALLFYFCKGPVTLLVHDVCLFARLLYFRLIVIIFNIDYYFNTFILFCQHYLLCSKGTNACNLYLTNNLSREISILKKFYCAFLFCMQYEFIALNFVHMSVFSIALYLLVHFFPHLFYVEMLTVVSCVCVC